MDSIRFSGTAAQFCITTFSLGTLLCAIIDCAKKSKFVITVENHSVIGGLGSAVCEVLADNCPTVVKRIGVNDKFGQSGTAEQLLDCYGLSAEKLKETIKQYINEYCKK